MQTEIRISIGNNSYIVEGDVDFNVSLVKNKQGVFDWIVDVPRMQVFYTYTEEDESEKEGCIDFDPFEWKVFVKESVGVVSTGGFYPSFVEMDVDKKFLSIYF